MAMDSQYREQPKWRQLCKLLPCEDPIKDRNMETITLLCAVLLFWSTTATYAQNSSAVVSAASGRFQSRLRFRQSRKRAWARLYVVHVGPTQLGRYS